MALDKAVDSVQLNNGLASICNAVREKSGSNASLEFPAGIVGAIEDIETGINPSGTLDITENGTYSVEQYAKANVNVSGGGTQYYMAKSGFLYSANMEYTEVTSLEGYAYSYANNLVSVHFPNCNYVGGAWAFSYCPNLKSSKFEQLTSVPNAFCRSITSLETMEFGSAGHPVTSIRSTSFYGDTQRGLTITVFVNASTLADAQAISDVGTTAPWGATNATIIYKSSTTGEVLT